MPNEPIKNIYDFYTSKGVKLPDYNSFEKELLSSSDALKNAYDGMGELGVKMPDYSIFESDVKKKDISQPTSGKDYPYYGMQSKESTTLGSEFIPSNSRIPTKIDPEEYNKQREKEQEIALKTVEAKRILSSQLSKGRKYEDIEKELIKTYPPLSVLNAKNEIDKDTHKAEVAKLYEDVTPMVNETVSKYSQQLLNRNNYINAAKELYKRAIDRGEELPAESDQLILSNMDRKRNEGTYTGQLYNAIQDKSKSFRDYFQETLKDKKYDKYTKNQKMQMLEAATDVYFENTVKPESQKAFDTEIAKSGDLKLAEKKAKEREAEIFSAEYKIKDPVNYIVQKSFDNSVLGSAANLATGRLIGADAYGYTPEKWEDVTTGVVSMLWDAPLFSAGGQIGSSIGKGVFNSTKLARLSNANAITKTKLLATGFTEAEANNLITKSTEKILNAYQGYGAGAGAFALYDSANQALNEVKDNDWENATYLTALKSIGNVALKGVEGAITGSVLHGMNLGLKSINKYVDRHISNKALNLSVKGVYGIASIPVEAGVFTGLTSIYTGETPTSKSFQDNLEFIVGLKLMHGVQNVFTPAKWLPKDSPYRKENIEINGVEYKLGESTAESLVYFSPKLNYHDKETTIIREVLDNPEQLNKYLTDDKVPLVAKAEVLNLATGQRVKSLDILPTKYEYTEHNDYISLYNKEGQLVDYYTKGDKKLTDVDDALKTNAIHREIMGFTPKEKASIENEFENLFDYDELFDAIDINKSERNDTQRRLVNQYQAKMPKLIQDILDRREKNVAPEEIINTNPEIKQPTEDEIIQDEDILITPEELGISSKEEPSKPFEIGEIAWNEKGEKGQIKKDGQQTVFDTGDKIYELTEASEAKLTRQSPTGIDTKQKGYVEIDGVNHKVVSIDRKPDGSFVVKAKVVKGVDENGKETYGTQKRLTGDKADQVALEYKLPEAEPLASPEKTKIKTKGEAKTPEINNEPVIVKKEKKTPITKEDINKKTEKELEELIKKEESDQKEFEEMLLDEAAGKVNEKEAKFVRVDNVDYLVRKKKDGDYAVVDMFNKSVKGDKAIEAGIKYEEDLAKEKEAALEEAAKYAEESKKRSEDKIMKALDWAIEKTDLRGTTFADFGVVAVPAFVANSALKTVRAAYKVGMSIKDAVKKGYEYLEANGYKITEKEWGEYVIKNINEKEEIPKERKIEGEEKGVNEGVNIASKQEKVAKNSSETTGKEGSKKEGIKETEKKETKLDKPEGDIVYEYSSNEIQKIPKYVEKYNALKEKIKAEKKAENENFDEYISTVRDIVHEAKKEGSIGQKEADLVLKEIESANKYKTEKKLEEKRAESINKIDKLISKNIVDTQKERITTKIDSFLEQKTKKGSNKQQGRSLEEWDFKTKAKILSESSTNLESKMVDLETKLATAKTPEEVGKLIEDILLHEYSQAVKDYKEIVSSFESMTLSEKKNAIEDLKNLETYFKKTNKEFIAKAKEEAIKKAEARKVVKDNAIKGTMRESQSIRSEMINEIVSTDLSNADMLDTMINSLDKKTSDKLLKNKSKLLAMDDISFRQEIEKIAKVKLGNIHERNIENSNTTVFHPLKKWENLIGILETVFGLGNKESFKHVQSVYDKLENGARDFEDFYMKATKDINDIMHGLNKKLKLTRQDKKKEFGIVIRSKSKNKLTPEKYEEHPELWELSPSQVVKIAADMRQSDIKVDYERQYGEDGANKLQAHVESIIKNTPDLEKYLNESIAYFEKLYPIVNEVYRRLNNADMANNKGYVPAYKLDRMNEDLITEIVTNDKVNSKRNLYLNPSPIKSRKGGGKIDISVDMEHAMQKYRDVMASYVGFAEGKAELVQLLTDPDVRANVKKLTDGKTYLKILDTFLNNIPNPQRLAPDYLSTMIRNIVLAPMSLNPKMLLTQGSGLFNFSTSMIYDKVWQNIPVVNQTIFMKRLLTDKGISEYWDMYKNSAFVYTRLRKGGDRDFELFYNNRLLPTLKSSTPTKKKINQIVKFIETDIKAGTIKIGDIAAFLGGKPVYFNQKDILKKEHPGWSEEKLKEEAFKKMANMGENTQQTSYPHKMSYFQLSSSSKYFPYMSSPIQFMQRTNKAIRDISRQKGTWNDDLRSLNELTYYSLAAPIIYQATAKFYNWLVYGKEDEEVAVQENEAKKQIGKLLEVAGSGFIQGVPIAGDVVEFAGLTFQNKKAYNVEISNSLARLQDAADAATRVFKIMNEKGLTWEELDDTEKERMIKSLSKSLELSGYGVENIRKLTYRLMGKEDGAKKKGKNPPKNEIQKAMDSEFNQIKNMNKSFQ